jgi:O-antigen/teichoic acid export membrane protein
LANLGRPLGIAAMALISSATEAMAFVLAGAVSVFVLGCLASYALLVRYGVPKFQGPRDLWSCANFTANIAVRTSQFSLDRLLLSAVLPPGALANYSIAVRALQLGYLPLQVVSRQVVPRYFSIATRKSREVLPLARQTVIAMAAMGIAATLLLIALTPFIVLILGEEYGPAADLLWRLSPTMILVAVYMAGQDLMTGLDLQLPRLAVNMIFVALQLGCLTILANYYGLPGVVWAIVAGSALAAVLPWSVIALVKKWPSNGNDPN